MRDFSEYAKLITEIENLKTQLKREQECVDFYANKESWISRNQDNSNDVINFSDCDVIHSGLRFQGGKRARETVKMRGENG